MTKATLFRRLKLQESKSISTMEENDVRLLEHGRKHGAMAIFKMQSHKQRMFSALKDKPYRKCIITLFKIIVRRMELLAKAKHFGTHVH